MKTAIDEYLEKLPQEQGLIFGGICATVRRMVPDVEETFAYAMPMFKYQGEYLLGFLPWKRHLSIYPCSGKVLTTLKEQLEGFTFTKGALHFTQEKPLPQELLEAIITTRVQEILHKRTQNSPHK